VRDTIGDKHGSRPVNADKHIDLNGADLNTFTEEVLTAQPPPVADQQPDDRLPAVNPSCLRD
jgi:hypothetical protein